LFVKALLDRVRVCEKENKAFRIDLARECEKPPTVTLSKGTQVSFPRRQIGRIRKTFRSFTRSNRIAPFKV